MNKTFTGVIYYSIHELIAKAYTEFEDHEYKNEILSRIEKRLTDFHYQEYLNRNERPYICLDWEDTLWESDGTSEKDKIIIGRATGFIQKYISCQIVKSM